LKTNFKHLNKKDPTTRIKALTHITTNIKDKPQDEIVRILPEWVCTTDCACVFVVTNIVLGDDIEEVGVG
jgi:hypothetical protein